MIRVTLPAHLRKLAQVDGDPRDFRLLRRHRRVGEIDAALPLAAKLDRKRRGDCLVRCLLRVFVGQFGIEPLARNADTGDRRGQREARSHKAPVRGDRARHGSVERQRRG